MSVLKASEVNWKPTAAASSPGNTHSARVRAPGAFFRVCACVSVLSLVCVFSWTQKPGGKEEEMGWKFLKLKLKG